MSLSVSPSAIPHHIIISKVYGHDIPNEEFIQRRRLHKTVETAKTRLKADRRPDMAWVLSLEPDSRQ